MNKIQKFRKTLGLTQAELAKKLNIGTRTVERAEAREPLDPSVIQKYLDASNETLVEADFRKRSRLRFKPNGRKSIGKKSKRQLERPKRRGD